MSNPSTPEQLVAAALYEMRLLLAPYLGSTATADLPVRVAAHLACALHNDALRLLEGKPTDVDAALAQIEAIDRVFNAQLLQRLALHAGKAEA